MMLLALLISALASITPFISQSMIDKGLVPLQIPHVVYCALLLILFYVSKQLIEYLQKKVEITISNDIGKKLQVKAISHGMKIKSTYYKEHGIYKIISDAFFDIGAILTIAQNQFLTVFILAFEIVGVGIGLYLLDWRLALCVTALIPIKYLLNSFLSKRAERLSREVRDQNKAYHRWLDDVVQGIIDIKLWGLHEKKVQEYSELVSEINHASKKQQLLQTKNNSLSTSVEQVVFTGLYIVGAYLILGGSLTLGGLISFLSFASYLLLPVTILLQLKYILRQITPNVDSLKAFFQMEEETSGQLPADGAGCIEFSHVSLELGGKRILQDISFSLHRGEKIAVIGENGSGKSTLINLILRLYEPTSGQILLNGVPIQNYEIEAYRRLFNVVTQGIHLFNGTIRENVCLDDNPLGEETEISFCSDFIGRWQEEFDTPVGNDGTKLSGGERQKIALLRALHRKAKILILDEPTSSYDIESSANFDNFIKETEAFDLVLIVTHHLGVLDGMDQVIELQDGKIADIKKEGQPGRQCDYQNLSDAGSEVCL
ncbi:ABC transporter ATP-binding protein [Zongyangia hominis]|uniref:ABC transporter ATP-binding protein n=1 Tax=Zongyangia hominis TaxID=2763677 RepID=A0A926E7W8_9FIRM|nr:ABC transporter ATP-binding protein [Zongyangia hominis]MBC8569495.1 ABC transporter ATP-binding protein [Zongyangia hominis]